VKCPNGSKTVSTLSTTGGPPSRGSTSGLDHLDQHLLLAHAVLSKPGARAHLVHPGT
jgi:hypothetical protein